MRGYDLWQSDQRLRDIDNEGEYVEVCASADGLEIKSDTLFVHDMDEFFDEIDLFEDFLAVEFGDLAGVTVQAYVSNNLLAYEKTWR